MPYYFFAVLLLLARLSPPARADVTAAAGTEEREQCQLAIVDELEGDVTLLSSDGNSRTLLKDGAIQPGDQLNTAGGAWSDLRLCDGTALRVGENSRFYYEGADNERESFAAWAFRLVSGSLRAAVVSSEGGDRVKLRVRTPSAAMGVRGTEFVAETSDAGNQETQLHTLEGEVLMGPEKDFDKLGTLRGEELSRQFEPVGKEKMSLIHAGEKRALPAAAFKTWEFARDRQQLLGRPLKKRGWTEIRPRFQAVHQRLKKKKGERPLFERPREVLRERVEEPEREERSEAPKTAIPFPKQREAIQEKRAAKEGRREAQRQKVLEKQLERNKQKAMDKRLRKGWRKNLDQKNTSPRYPDLGK
jgi:hypothetical protein